MSRMIINRATVSTMLLTVLLCLFSVSDTVAFAPLNGVTVTSVSTGEPVDLGTFAPSSSINTNTNGATDNDKSMLILSTYCADFNNIEYLMRLRFYAKALRDRGVSRLGVVMNGNAAAAKLVAELVDLDDETELYIDPTGAAGRAFGVSRGWLPDNADLNPFLKLFGMLWGLGAWATLPAVIGGYIGNPFVAQPWIEDAMAVGIRKGRWPDNALELSQDGSTVLVNKFTELPVVGEWKRRPLELATLRLQSMMGISLQHWDTLAPDQEGLDAGVLTQLGGCVVVDGKGDAIFEWKDPGICAVANFEDILAKLDKQS